MVIPSRKSVALSNYDCPSCAQFLSFLSLALHDSKAVILEFLDDFPDVAGFDNYAGGPVGLIAIVLPNVCLEPILRLRCPRFKQEHGSAIDYSYVSTQFLFLLFSLLAAGWGALLRGLALFLSPVPAFGLHREPPRPVVKRLRSLTAPYSVPGINT